MFENDVDRLPPEIEARLLKLLSAGAIDERDAADIRTCYDAHPVREWELIFHWLEDSR